MVITQALLWADWRALLRQDDLEEICKILRGTYLAMGQSCSPEMITLNAMDLVREGHAPDDVMRACRALRMAPVPEHKIRRAPLAGDIHNWLMPPAAVDDLADTGMQKVMGAISRFGYMQGEAVAEYVGETVWSVIKRLGGWTTLCASTQEGCTTTKAQLRRSLESAYRAETSAVRAAQLASKHSRDDLKLAQTRHSREGTRQGMAPLADVLPLLQGRP